MYGCPNRCRHCWVGHSPNGRMTFDDLKQIAAKFKSYAHEFEISVWRIVRGCEYVKWLVSLGVTKAQLTLFGGEALTDYYTGRTGAYREILHAVDILLENKISPRIQVFVNKDNIEELPLIEALILENRLPERCVAFGGEFSCFAHQDSCDGENAKLYNVRVTPDDLKKIPPLLTDYTLKHFHADNLNEVFGQTERELYRKLIADTSTGSYVSDSPVLYIDSAYNVYPNISTTAPYWCLGNLKESSAEEILRNYLSGKSTAQTVRREIPLCEIVKRCGDPNSLRLFGKQDYIAYLLNQYCEGMS